MTPRFCFNCGAAYPDPSHAFCRQCGTPTLTPADSQRQLTPQDWQVARGWCWFLIILGVARAFAICVLAKSDSVVVVEMVGHFTALDVVVQLIYSLVLFLSGYFILRDRATFFL
jgi:hypothetical protein